MSALPLLGPLGLTAQPAIVSRVFLQCCWFTDPDEASALLQATAAGNPEKDLKLLVAGLGGAFTSCNGFPDGGLGGELKMPDGDASKVELRLQGSHGLVNEVKPRLLELLKAQGIDPGHWVMPVFMCEELQSATLYPVFLHPADLAAVWEKAGRDPDKLPENLTVMDIRMLVQAMATDETNAWNILEFVGSTKAAELALEVQTSQKVEAA